MNFFKYDSWAIVAKDYSLGSKSYKIIELLKNHECNVVGINYENNIRTNNIFIYESLKDVPHNIDVVVIVDETIETYVILEEMELLDINNIWFEKDSYNDAIIKKAKSLNINVIYGISLCKAFNIY
ncbi:hypothetical protein SDC9_206771 [bioreactor metagenome]|uniref:CoA-binding domain-containing protein n=1 Tax=bioreactor metagenome TaxID=1076179 RepID=A0A645JHH3_9ZZZZ|nr:CoA-binding protein [Romboutsia lituseburensis]